MTLLFNTRPHQRFRRRLRAEATRSERCLWKLIRNDQLGIRFRRQYGIGNYIVDFYVPTRRMVIEIDGGYHFSSEGQRAYDRIRQDYLESLGLKVLRFTNQEVDHQIEAVLQKIQATLDSTSSPSPPPFAQNDTPSSQRGGRGES